MEFPRKRTEKRLAIQEASGRKLHADTTETHVEPVSVICYISALEYLPSLRLSLRMFTSTRQFVDRVLGLLEQACRRGRLRADQLAIVDRVWNEGLADCKLPFDEASDSDVWQRIMRIRDRLAKVRIDSKDQFLAHEFYWRLASIAFRAFGEQPQISVAYNEMVDTLRDDHFVVLREDQRKVLYDCLGRLFALLDEYSAKTGDAYRHPPYSVRQGYDTGTEANLLPNQRFYPCVPDEVLDGMSHVFQDSGLDVILQSYFDSNYCVANIRAWKYCSPGVVTDNSLVGVHRDRLPPGTIKLMYFDGEITPAHGCFEAMEGGSIEDVRRNDRPLVQVTGHNPAILVDASRVFHRALAPRPGLERNTIELSIMPFLDPRSNRFVDGGANAGGPLNPFGAWHMRTCDPAELVEVMTEPERQKSIWLRLVDGSLFDHSHRKAC